MEDSEALSQFCAITGASEHTARFYLEQAQGDVQEAIEHYYAAGGKEAPAAPPAAAPPAAAAGAGGDSSQPARGRGGAGAGARRVPSGNIRSLGDLGGEEESEGEEDEDNEYYAGGAKSGVAVRGGPKEGGHRDHVADLFEGARRAGAEEGRAEDLQGSGPGFRAFAGTARTLAGGPVAAPSVPQQAQQPEVRRVTIAFYANGIFTVDDGEPRDVRDPANAPFMQAIMEGRCPPELDPGSPDIALDVNLVRKDEEYREPAKPKVVAFAGTGRRLGGDEEGASTSAAAAAAAPPANAGAPMVTWEGPDESQPTTSIQLRLADGSRMVAKFNLTHTVADIRRFIHASRPGQSHTFRLVTAFPAQQLDDDSATIQGAGLANSVIIQK